MSVLAQLLAATPSPPVDAEVDALLAAFDAMARHRQVLLDAITEIVISEPERVILQELAVRADAWKLALIHAQGTIIDRRIGVGKVRAYGSSG